MFQFQNSFVSVSIVEDRRREAAEYRLVRQVRKGGHRRARVRPVLGSARVRRALGVAVRPSRRQRRPRS